MTVPRVAVLRVASVVTVMTGLIVLASPFVAFTQLKRGVENDAAYARLLMEATEREWRKDTAKPLKLIAGPFVLVSAAAFYGKDRPSTYAHFSNYLSPWVDDARIGRDGIAIMCTDVPLCLQYMNEVAAHHRRRLAPGGGDPDAPLGSASKARPRASTSRSCRRDDASHPTP